MYITLLDAVPISKTLAEAFGWLSFMACAIGWMLYFLIQADDAYYIPSVKLNVCIRAIVCRKMVQTGQTCFNMLIYRYGAVKTNKLNVPKYSSINTKTIMDCQSVALKAQLVFVICVGKCTFVI